MAKNKKDNERDALKESIKPVDIVFDEDDSQMPKPLTRTYKQYLKVTDKFMNLLYNTIGKLPYSHIMENASGSKIRLSDFIRYIEQHKDKIDVNEMNQYISYIANQEFTKVRPLMELIDSKENQGQLWQVFEA